MEIGIIPSVNRSLYTDNNPALRPISKYESNFNKSGVSPLGTWASQHKNLIKTSEQPKNIHQDDNALRYNVLPQNEFKNIQLDSSLGSVAPKQTTPFAAKPPIVEFDLTNLSNIDNHLISIPVSSHINNAPKDNIFSILGQPHIPTNLSDLNKFENHLSGLQQAEKVNNLSSQVGAALSHNKFNHLKQLAAQSKY